MRKRLDGTITMGFSVCSVTGAMIACALIAVPSVALAQESTSFSMDRVTVTSAAQTVASTNFETTVLFGQASPHGAASSCNTGYVNSLGFWSVLGDLPVPVRLRLGRGAGDPSQVELSWTGADEVFQVFRSPSAADVLEPWNLLAETSECGATDNVTGSDDLVFYQVVPRPSE